MNWGMVGAIAGVIGVAVAAIFALEHRAQWAFEQWRIEHQAQHRAIWCSINPETCMGKR